MKRKDQVISTQNYYKDLLISQGKSKYLAFKPISKLRSNGVLAFFRGLWLKPAFLLRFRVGVLTIFLFFFAFNTAFAASESIFDNNNSLNWIKSHIAMIFEDEGGEENLEIQESQNLIVSQDGYVLKTSSPDMDSQPADQRRELIAIYRVREGDNLTSIANNFGISLNTLMWANDLGPKEVIKIGQELKILPIEGVAYVVKKGDNLSEISKKYKSDIEQIIDFNNLPADGSLKEGVQLILPNGIMPLIPVSSNKASGSIAKTNATIKKVTSAAWEAAEKLFIVPVSGIITQGKHSYTPPAIDIGNSCGTPVFAAADGVVTMVFETSSRSRYAGGGYGNNIRIQHSNGSLSIYAHLLYGTLLVKEGDLVKQGQKIAEIGGGWESRSVRMPGAGRSSGCHLHFEVRNGINPFTKYRKGVALKTPAANLAIDTSASGAGDTDDSGAQQSGVGFSGTPAEVSTSTAK